MFFWNKYLRITYATVTKTMVFILAIPNNGSVLTKYKFESDPFSWRTIPCTVQQNLLTIT